MTPKQPQSDPKAGRPMTVRCWPFGKLAIIQNNHAIVPVRVREMKQKSLDLSTPKYSLPEKPQGIAVVRAHFDTISEAKAVGWTWKQLFGAIHSTYPGVHKTTKRPKKRTIALKS